MKHWRWLMIAAAVALVLIGCEKQPSINESDLYGYWYGESTKTYMRFMHDTSQMADGYYLGYEWKDGDKLEKDLWDIDYHTNGWFEWYITKDNKQNTLTLINLSTSAKIPKVYTINDLTSSRLEYTDGSKTHIFSKSTQPQ